MESQVQDRVFTCPHCGETGGLILYSTDRFRHVTGVGLALYCTKCDLVNCPVNVTWELAHLFLRTTVQSVRIEKTMLYPSQWSPLDNWNRLSNSAAYQWYDWISEVWIKYFHSRSECRLKHTARKSTQVMFNLVYSAAGCTGDLPVLGVPHYVEYLDRQTRFLLALATL